MGIRLVTVLLEARGVRLSRGDREVLRGVALTVNAGEVCALMGLSGSGKTTFLRAAVALEPFDSGSIAVGGATLGPGAVPPQSRLAALRGSVGMVFQAHALFENLTVLENVALAPVHAQRVARSEAQARARGLLESLGIGARADAFPRQLSGGEAQRAAIARALAVDPPLLLMDEPTASLDPARRGSLGAALKRLASEGRGLLIATHDVDFALDAADRAVILADGAVVEEGPAVKVLGQPSHPSTAELLAKKSTGPP